MIGARPSMTTPMPVNAPRHPPSNTRRLIASGINTLKAEPTAERIPMARPRRGPNRQVTMRV